MSDQRPITDLTDAELQAAYVDVLNKLLNAWLQVKTEQISSAQYDDELLILENRASMYSIEIRLRKLSKGKGEAK